MLLCLKDVRILKHRDSMELCFRLTPKATREQQSLVHMCVCGVFYILSAGTVLNILSSLHISFATSGFVR